MVKAALIAAALSSALVLCSCTLEDEEADDLIDTSHHFTEQTFEPGSLEAGFIDRAQRCIAGDLTDLDALIEDYLSTYRDQKSSNSQLFQQYAVNRYFENCAFKALQLKDSRAYDAMLRRPMQCARVARKFYEMNMPSDAAYWLQRVLNLQGQEQGYTTLGMTFIRHPSTLAIGAKLLQEGARLGSRQARETLLSLTHPSSKEYQDVLSALREDYIKKVQSGELPPPPRKDTAEAASDNAQKSAE